MIYKATQSQASNSESLIDNFLPRRKVANKYNIASMAGDSEVSFKSTFTQLPIIFKSQCYVYFPKGTKQFDILLTNCPFFHTISFLHQSTYSKLKAYIGFNQRVMLLMQYNINKSGVATLYGTVLMNIITVTVISHVVKD